LLRVYIAESLVDGQLVLNLLEDSGVPAELFHQNSTGGLGELPVVNPEVWIKRDLDHEKACRIVREFSCRPVAVNTMTCPLCGEQSPDSFEICWQCHSALPATDSH
jgi:hypothetical protein